MLFEPTKAANRQFRPTPDAALSYFVGCGFAGSSAFPEDDGFAIRPWIAVRFENAGVLCGHDHAIAMGNYYFTAPDGQVTKVEYTFGYVRRNKRLKINVHHSSLPYVP